EEREIAPVGKIERAGAKGVGASAPLSSRLGAIAGERAMPSIAEGKAGSCDVDERPQQDEKNRERLLIVHGRSRVVTKRPSGFGIGHEPKGPGVVGPARQGSG